MYEIVFYGACAVIALAIVVPWLIGYQRRYADAVGEVRDYRHKWGFLWRREAPRLVVRERKNGRGNVRLVFRDSSTTLHTDFTPDEARRIARALREAAGNPLPGARP